VLRKLFNGISLFLDNGKPNLRLQAMVKSIVTKFFGDIIPTKN